MECDVVVALFSSWISFIAKQSLATVLFIQLGTALLCVFCIFYLRGLQPSKNSEIHFVFQNCNN